MLNWPSSSPDSLGGFTIYSLPCNAVFICLYSFHFYLFPTYDKTVLQFLASACCERNF